MDGDVLEISVDKCITNIILLKSKKHNYINTTKVKCSTESYWDCYASELAKTDFKNCPRKCSPFSLPFKDSVLGTFRLLIIVFFL